MIHCDIVKKVGKIQRFRIEGHAGFADLGNDIVCAAVSMLTTNAINSCEALLNVIPRTSEVDGDLVCVVERADSEEVQLLFQSMVFGLEQIAEQYPRHVKVRTRDLKE